MRQMMGLTGVAIALALGGCATIIEGTDQAVLIEIVPPSGTCTVSRNGQVLGQSTPQQRSVRISKSKDDLIFDCQAPGYQPKNETLASALSAATVASFFLIDLGLVDAATGAWMKYPTKVTVVLHPLAPALPAPIRRR